MGSVHERRGTQRGAAGAPVRHAAAQGLGAARRESPLTHDAAVAAPAALHGHGHGGAAPLTAEAAIDTRPAVEQLAPVRELSPVRGTRALR
jgi:hypothetical protein